MKARDLMFGDWVLMRHTHSKEKTAEKVFGIGREVILYRNEAGVQSVDRIFIEPMLLTQEMLTKNGFEWDDYWDEYRLIVDDVEYAILWDLDGFFVELAAHSERVQIDYVHQLQNLLRLCGLYDLADNFKIE